MSQTGKNVLAGRQSRNDVPHVESHVIRVYLCSAGTDSMTERDAFLEDVYPRLRSYCKDLYGLEFQIVDLNWGLSPDGIYNQTVLDQLRKREINKCLELSAGPNFIAFLGQKYGGPSLPTTIQSEDFDSIQLALRSRKGRDARKAQLLDQCYLLDDNNIPPVYVLKDKGTLVPEMADNNVETRSLAQTKWQTMQEELTALIHKGAEFACLNGSMDQRTTDRYLLSELEMEILLGTETSDHPNKRCVLITRTIEDLKNYTHDPRTARFTDVRFDSKKEQFEIDQVSAQMMLKLKNRVTGLVSVDNTIHHDVLWRYEDVIHPKLHEEYLHSLCEKVYTTCVRLIDQCVSNPDTNVPRTCEEPAQHWTRCHRLASNFHRQSSALTSIKEYVTGLSTTPLIVYGPSGCGKSTIISKLALEMEDLLSSDLIVVLRYVGVTPSSADLRQILISVCTEVAMATGESIPHVPSDVKEVVKYFAEMTSSVPASSRLVIILDGLDQLTPAHTTFSFPWLPRVLPPNVKLVLTLQSTPDGLVDELLTDHPERFLEVAPINVGECEELFVDILSEMRRSLTPSQMKVFRSAIQGDQHPLYIQFLVNIAQDIHSQTDVESLNLPQNCEIGVLNLLDRMEAKHGHLLVSRAFAYMVASSTGLSDCEMEDLLSLDDDVLNEVFIDFHPPVRRIPYMKWLSLKQDVELFLTYKDVGDVTVTVWRHPIFDDAVNKRYLSDAVVAGLVHSNIADYFLGTWSGRPKPATVSKFSSQLDSSLCTDRKVPPQPHTYGRKHVRTTRFNKRMYEQVPHHLDLAGRCQELDSLVFFNYEWLYSKIKALSLQHVLADLGLNPSEEANLVADVLRASESVIEQDINNLPVEISAHLLPYYLSHPNIKSLIKQCDTVGLKHCALIPNFPYQRVPGGSLQLTIKLPSTMEHFMFVHEDRYLVCKKKDEAYVHTTDLTTGEDTTTVLASIGELHTTPNGKYLIIVDHVTERAIKIHEADTGAFIQQIIIMNHIEGKSDLFKKGPLSLTNDRLCAVVTLTNSVLCICDIPSGTVLSIIPLDGKACLCSITPNGRFVFCNSNEFLLAFDVYSQVHVLTVPLGSKPSQLIFTHDGLRAFLSNEADAKVTVMHLAEDIVEMTYRLVFDEKMPGDKIVDLKVSPDDSLLLLRGKKALVVQNRGQEKVIAVFHKPDNVSAESRLPGARHDHLDFTHAEFSRDSHLVIGAIFSNVYVWQIAGSSLLSVIQGHVGLITSMLVSRSRAQVITHMDKSKEIQVWDISEGVRRVTTPCKMTDAIAEFQVTSDNSLTFVKCRQVDALGLIDMRNGCILHLMTHETAVQDFAISPDGNWALVSTSPKLNGSAFKLWNIEERRIVLESGDVAGYCVGMDSLPCIIMVAQKTKSFRAPYFISLIRLTSDVFYEHVCTDTSVEIVRSKPFTTHSDQYLIINSALNLDTSADSYSQPCLHLFQVENGMRMSTWDASNMNFEEHLLDILEVRPCCQQNGNLVAAIFSCVDRYKETLVRADIDTSKERVTSTYGFFLLDVSTGSLTLLCIPFPKPSYGVASHPLIIAPDCSMCLDEMSNIFHITSGEFIGQVSFRLGPPRAFALQGTVVLYYSCTMLNVVRVSDGATIASCNVKAPVCHLHVCSDDRTVLVGCEDGAVMCYTIIDPDRENAALILESSVLSRAVGDHEMLDRSLGRSRESLEQTSTCQSSSSATFMTT